MKWKMEKATLCFAYIKYGKFGSVSLGYFIKHKPRISEVCPIYLLYITRPFWLQRKGPKKWKITLKCNFCHHLFDELLMIFCWKFCFVQILRDISDFFTSESNVAFLKRNFCYHLFEFVGVLGIFKSLTF